MKTLTEVGSHLESVATHPGMFFFEPYYPSLCAYIFGLDFMMEGTLLAGFQKRIDALGGLSPIHWSASFPETLHPDTGRRALEKIKEDKEADQAACRALVETLCAFIRERK